jgi:pantothenate kinase
MTNTKLAVEWLAKSYVDLLTKLNNEEISLKEFEIQYIELLEQAKEMEKQQAERLSASWAKSREQTRETAMHIGFAKGFMSGLECHEDYYEELNRTQLEEDEFMRNYITDRFEETYEGNK